MKNRRAYTVYMNINNNIFFKTRSEEKIDSGIKRVFFAVAKVRGPRVL